MRFNNRSNEGAATVHQTLCGNATLVSRVITGDESRIYGYDPKKKQQSSQWKSPNSPRPIKTRHVMSKVKSMLIIFFDIRGTVRKKFVLAGETVNFAYYCDVSCRLRENVPRLRPEVWRQKNWLLHHNRRFHTLELIGTKSLAVLNTVTEHDFWHAF
jgi:histone-lysine N-methyltransferase SETMAR